ncbi:hypothetical protein LXA43DRAFT_1066507 [Ganoderma leucocontextum]|nr:hypothetical protein LXA43DRAFT_1066507 [Ganoderma leucocontextum]
MTTEVAEEWVGDDRQEPNHASARRRSSHARRRVPKEHRSSRTVIATAAAHVDDGARGGGGWPTTGRDTQQRRRQPSICAVARVTPADASRRNIDRVGPSSRQQQPTSMIEPEAAAGGRPQEETRSREGDSRERPRRRSSHARRRVPKEHRSSRTVIATAAAHADDGARGGGGWPTTGRDTQQRRRQPSVCAVARVTPADASRRNIDRVGPSSRQQQPTSMIEPEAAAGGRPQEETRSREGDSRERPRRRSSHARRRVPKEHRSSRTVIATAAAHADDGARGGGGWPTTGRDTQQRRRQPSVCAVARVTPADASRRNIDRVGPSSRQQQPTSMIEPEAAAGGRPQEETRSREGDSRPSTPCRGGGGWPTTGRDTQQRRRQPSVYTVQASAPAVARVTPADASRRSIDRVGPSSRQQQPTPMIEPEAAAGGRPQEETRNREGDSRPSAPSLESRLPTRRGGTSIESDHDRSSHNGYGLSSRQYTWNESQGVVNYAFDDYGTGHRMVCVVVVEPEVVPCQPTKGSDRNEISTEALFRGRESGTLARWTAREKCIGTAEKNIANRRENRNWDWGVFVPVCLAVDQAVDFLFQVSHLVVAVQSGLREAYNNWDLRNEVGISARVPTCV